MSEAPLTLQGPAGPLEARLLLPEVPPLGVAVVCHPHSLHGGSLGNKVVHQTAATLGHKGFAVLRFNFRGVGASAGAFDAGVGETEDLLAACAAVRARFPGVELWLAGFSFGAYVALRAAPACAPARLITLAPPVNLFDFDALPAPGCPWLLVQGEDDELVPAAAVRRWLSGQARAVDARFLPGVGHFFHGRLNLLRQTLEQALFDSS
ncbi:alpha/beta hydrolase [Thiohalobacter sp.]|uniref:alpha/beta hydrolase n=1 Tax=Thiohalobacter sp. TaxID=2025948 RepID=UPI00261AAC58|nr:alpha/beta fold hydrolase [Thiohalobacter sp.]